MKKIYELQAELRKTDTTTVGIDRIVDYEPTRYLYDTLCEIADNNVDVYNSDLLDWLKDNYDEFEKTIDEYGLPTGERFDLIKWIQMAQGRTYENELCENKEDIVLFWIYEQLKDNNIEELEDEQNRFFETINSTCATDAIKGDYKQRWGILNAMYRAYIMALDYKPIGWREPEEESATF